MAVQEHHKQAEFAYNRPAYREARWERSVKVYTVNQESRYLLVQNVHALGVTKDLLDLFSQYGKVEEYRLLDEYPSEPYTDVYWIKFADISAARLAKRKADNRSFFGKTLHVCYAPEFESVADTREKLKQRRKVIAQKTRGSYEAAQQELQDRREPSTVAVATDSQTDTSMATTLKLSSEESPSVSTAADQPPDSSVKSHDYHVPGLPPLPLLPLPPVPGGEQSSGSHGYPSASATGGEVRGDGRLVPPHAVEKCSTPSKQSKEIQHLQRGGGQTNPAGLSKNERMNLFLQTSVTGVTAHSTRKQPQATAAVKRVEPKPLSLPTQKSCTRDKAVHGQKATPGGSAAPVTIRPPCRPPDLQTGDRSLDKSVQVVRQQMTKVSLETRLQAYQCSSGVGHTTI